MAAADLVVRKCSISELEADPNILPLLDEYAEELTVSGLPHPSAKMETYKHLEKMGSLQPLAAYLGDKLIGIINVLMVPNPHYGMVIGVSESFFVAKAYRKTGAGLKLLRAAEKIAGAPGFLVSAPSSGPLAEVLPKSGYLEISRTFFRRICHA